MAFTATPGSFTPINIWAMLRNLINQGCPILTNAGVPTNGTSGTYAGQAGIGALIIDTTNGDLYINTGTLASPTWAEIALDVTQFTALAVSGVVPVGSSASYVITKAGVYLGSIAAPAASPGGDGVQITITSDTANAHVITFTGGTLDSGAAGATTATFPAVKGASISVVSYNGRWKLMANNLVVIT